MIEFKTLLNSNLTFNASYKMLNQKGNLVYEYNPLRNYRLNKLGFEYQGHIYNLQELFDKFKIVLKIDNIEKKEISNDELVNNNNWIWSINDKILSVNESPILRKKGELVDFDSSELNFDLHNPVQMLAQSSYDGSVNLILNDGKNAPKLINSRFSPLGKNKYQIIDRKGDNDTNIYDEGEQFDIDTSLYKKTTLIPKLNYYGTFPCGNLPIGTYHFYFKCMDADGNETDFIAESGKVQIFIGDIPYNIHTGFRNENSHKGASFLLKNLDSSYQYISVYYTKSTSDINENAVVSAFKVDQKFLVNSAKMCQIKITGFEHVTEIPIYSINNDYQIASKVETQASCQNMLFFGNISKRDINFKELTDISLRIYPILDNNESYEVSNKISEDYEPRSEYEKSYYNSQYIYEKTGYWPGEIYRFGIVYIFNDNTLSPVFNIRGIEELTIDDSKFTTYPFFNQTNSRNYIAYDDETNILIPEQNSDKDKLTLIQNCKGVVKFPDNSDAINKVFGIKFKLTDFELLRKELLKLGIQGFFFVRQKRIPTTLCQAYTIGIDKNSHTPIIPYNNEYYSECFLDQGLKNNSDKCLLTHEYLNHLYKLNDKSVNIAAICPDYDVNYPYYNSIFNGDKFTIVRESCQPEPLKRLNYCDRYYYTNTTSKLTPIVEKAHIQFVEDNTKLVAIDDIFFSARAGECEEAFRYEYAEKELVLKDSTNLIRGSFGPYLGFKGLSMEHSLINIKIPNYNSNNISEYFGIRYNDKSSYSAIGDRISLSELKEEYTCYRGDCYICQFTHRINRNFQDPSAPANDKFVDPKCWKNNYKIKDGVVSDEGFKKINLGDVNAVELGQWITFTVRSTYNLNIRSLDRSMVDEEALFGHPRTFFPNCPLSPRGIYKTPEALCYNKGFEKSLSERTNFEVPDAPMFKNDFTNRIAYSDINVNDAFKNGFRTFKRNHYRDYPKTYGQIIKLVEMQGNLLCVFEHGVALIPVNERALVGEGQGGNIYINTSNVLPENPKILSDTFGSQWKESVIKTPRGVYGVDTIGKKIWRTNGQIFECISDFKVQEFLNQNITLTEREITPIIGIRNVKTHYNKFKGDVMFTFYDNLYGFEEKSWNLCYNELLQKFITFYSWIPSYSENIYNQFFSFDRNTSKQIAKIGISNYGNDWSDGVTLTENIIKSDQFSTELHLSNRNIPHSNVINSKIKYFLGDDSFNNNKLFNIINLEGKSILTFTGKYEDIKYDLYKTDENGNLILNENPKNLDKIVLYLKIKAKVDIVLSKDNMTSLDEAYSQGFINGVKIDSKYYESVVAIVPEFNLQYLSTDFWKHGQGGIIDISDKILPTYWYGKQHPFEFEFIVNNNPQTHKIFNNLEIISNSAEPESFHYEIIGDCYEFAKDKRNMYIRQEATKELYQWNGCDISFDRNYINLNAKQRPIIKSDGTVSKYYDKSTLFPLYYSRQDKTNEIEDTYHLKNGEVQSKDFSALSGGEIVHYDTLDEYRIWNHALAVDLNDSGRMRGNMQYKEDKWDIQINPLNFVQKNETKWANDLIPIELRQSPIPSSVISTAKENNGKIKIPDNSKNREVVFWNWEESEMKESKLKDKWIKIRIRYSGKKLAIITAIKTLYSISYA